MALFTFCAKWVTVSIAILSVVLGVIMFEVVPLLPGKVTLVSAAGEKDDVQKSRTHIFDFEVEVAGTPEQAYDQWIQHVWIQGGAGTKPVIISDYDKSTFLGMTRDVGFGIHEKIVAVDPAHKKKINYMIVGPAPGLIQGSHYGTVTFEKAAAGTSRVHWNIRLGLEKTNGVVDAMVKSILRVSISLMLRSLRQTMDVAAPAAAAAAAAPSK